MELVMACLNDSRTKKILISLVAACSLTFQAHSQSAWNDYVTGMTLVGRPGGGPSCLPIVWTVQPDTPAAQAGIAPGDHLLEIDGHKTPDIREAASLLHSSTPQTSHVRFLGKNGEYTVEVGRIRASDIFQRQGLKRGPNGMTFPNDATDAEMKRVSQIDAEPPKEEKAFNVGHYPADLGLYYPGFELWIWKGDRPITVGGIEDGAAQRAGIHYGDTILLVNGVDPRGRSASQIESLFSSTTPRSITIKIERDGVQRSITFELEKASAIATRNGKQLYHGRMIPSVIGPDDLHCWDRNP